LIEIVVMAGLGVASAFPITSLVIQFVDSISKLKSFCEAVKEETYVVYVIRDGTPNVTHSRDLRKK